MFEYVFCFCMNGKTNWESVEATDEIAARDRLKRIHDNPQNVRVIVQRKLLKRGLIASRQSLLV